MCIRFFASDYTITEIKKNGALPNSNADLIKKVFNWSEVHLSEVTSYKIHIFEKKSGVQMLISKSLNVLLVILHFVV